MILMVNYAFGVIDSNQYRGAYVSLSNMLIGPALVQNTAGNDSETGCKQIIVAFTYLRLASADFLATNHYQYIWRVTIRRHMLFSIGAQLIL